MPLPTVTLDDRHFQDIVDQAKRMIPQYCPEWTDHNVSDPGVTLIELFAWMTDMLLYRVNQVPERNYIKFLELIGLRLEPPRAARAPVTFYLSAPQTFDVVIPDAPGFGFSNPVTEAGWNTARVARAYDALMRRLGYTEYGIHGSDNGALVARELGLLNPDGFLGLHVLQLFSFPSGDPAEFERLEPQDYAGLEHMQWFQSVGGYNTMNASRPQTVAVGLSDSPVGLLAYSELFNSFGNGTSCQSNTYSYRADTAQALDWVNDTVDDEGGSLP